MTHKVLEMLRYRRPAGSPTERAFLERFVMPFNPIMMAGNLVVTVPGDSETLFSCHTDTVHRDHEMQTVLYDASLELAYKDDKEPLGADNTAGVWLLLEMIEAGLPGVYAFHYGEEKGCIGSRAMAKEHLKFLAEFKRAIAFDRRGVDSVITHQMGDECCSPAFCAALCDLLGAGYKADPTGSFTDTASYTHIIPECTNVSVGYEFEHGPTEMLDVSHLNWLRERALAIPWHTLPTTRMPSKESARETFSLNRWGNWGDSAGMYGLEDDDEVMVFAEKEYNDLIWESLAELKTYAQVDDLATHAPLQAAEFLWAYISRQMEWERAAAEAAKRSDHADPVVEAIYS